MSLLAEVKALYQSTKKPKDIAWNLYFARPLAALTLYFIRGTRLTPNQLTFLGFFLFVGGAAVVAGLANPLGFLIGALLMEGAYIIDQTDGQLARLKGMTSAVGAHLDFMIDTFKALLFVAALALSLWRSESEVSWLLAGLGGVLLVAIGTTLTTFVRRAEYAGEEVLPGTDASAPTRKKGPVGGLIWAAMATLRIVSHYPSWVVFVALADLLPAFPGRALALALYLGVMLLYVGKTSLGVLLKLGSSAFYR